MVHVQQHSETMYTTDIVNYINHSPIMVLFPPATTCNLKTLDNDLSYQNQAINGGTRHEACLSLRASHPIFLKAKVKVT